MEALALQDPPAIIMEVRKRRKASRRTGRTALFIGAVILMSDGSRCVIVAFDQKGRPLCAPAP